MTLKYKLFLLICITTFCVANAVADEVDDCDSNPDYATKKQECDDKGTDYIFRHIYTDGCDCITAAPAMVDDLANPPPPPAEGEQG
jgi:hypothetical protein